MALKIMALNKIHLKLFPSHSIPQDIRQEFSIHIAMLNYNRARWLAIILIATHIPLLYGDYVNIDSWDLNIGYKYLFEAHLTLVLGLILLLIGARLLNSSPIEKQRTQQSRRQAGFALITSIFLMCFSGYMSGIAEQFLDGQITVYLIGMFTISALIYLHPPISFVIYLASYIIFVNCLNSVPIGAELMKGHIINGGLLLLLAWFFSATLYQLRLKDFHTQMRLEEMVIERTAKLEEVNCQLEEEIIERQRVDEEMTQFFKAVPDLICFLNFDLVLTRVNDSFKELLGYSERDIKFMSLLELTHPEDIPSVDEAFEESKLKNVPLTKLETRLRRMNGTYISVEWNAVPDFERQLIFAVARDVTERNRNQEKVYRLASIVESTDDGIIGMSTDGTILYWNQGAEQVYGYSAKEIVGKSIYTIIDEDRRGEVVEIFRKAKLGEKLSHFETERRHQDGRILQVSLTVSPIKDNEGKVIGISTILRDISHSKRMERELTRLDRLNLIGEMAASISHEVRNPMTTVRGFLQLLYEKDDCVQYQSYFNLMIDELDRANSILTEFLSISRTKMTEKKWQNLNSIVYSILPLIEASAVTQSMQIHGELRDLPELLLDDKEMRQIILNLSRNGLEAMEEGGTLTIRTYALDDEVVLEVQDEGHGISTELIDRLGTPFLTTKNEGTGLGLAICHGIAARHDARIEVKCEERGTTFSVRFKRDKRNEI
jgi:PAS domain S-box-containing protein